MGASTDKTPPRTFLIGLAIARDAHRVSEDFYRAVESIVEQLEESEARERELTEAADRFVNWNEPRIVPTEEFPDQHAALDELRRVLNSKEPK